jgi:HD domain
MSETIAGIKIPDSKMAKDLTELIRDKEPDLLYHHSRRVYLFGALTGQRKGLAYDPELLYVGAMFHDIGLTEQYRHSMLRFEVDGANAAPRLPAEVWRPGVVRRNGVGCDRAPYHAGHPRAQESGGRARHRRRRDGRSRVRL